MTMQVIQGIQAIQDALHRGDGNPALLDTATGALSAIAFTMRVEEAASLAGRLGHGLSVVTIDLRRPQELLDRYGPHAVDTVLSAIVDRLWELARRSDTVARVGAARLAVLLPATDRDGADLYVARLVPVLADPYQLAGEPVEVRVDVTVTGVTADEFSEDTLLR